MKYLIHRIHRKIKGFLVLPIFHKASNKVFCMALVRGDLLDEVRGHWVPCLIKSDLWVCPPLMWSDIQHHFPQMMFRRLELPVNGTREIMPITSWYCHKKFMYVHIVLWVAGLLRKPGLARSGRNPDEPSMPERWKGQKSNTSCDFS